MPLQLLDTERDCLVIKGEKDEPARLIALIEQPKSIAFPDKHLEFIGTAITEYEQLSGGGILLQGFGDRNNQAVDLVAEIDGVAVEPELGIKRQSHTKGLTPRDGNKSRSS